MKIDSPQVSVVMPVHNALPFLEASIGSILNQSFQDFEFVILNDASTDGSEAILRKWEKLDPRIRVIESSQKLGLAGSSNRIVSASKAQIVARMDADDISHPDRLRRQLDILERHPDVVALGTLCDGIDASGKRTRPADRWRIVRRSRYIPFPHGSAMFRRKAFDAVGGYRKDFEPGEDQDLFFRMTSVGRVVTLPDVLYHFRYHTNNTTVLSGARGAIHSNGNGHNSDLLSLYMLGAMRLWSGQHPAISPQTVISRISHLNWQSLMTFTSASVGAVSPEVLRFTLRSIIRARNSLARVRVKDGRPYEWRLK
ncbi:MAG TPA: glycosyltransferase family 2 protein [Pyrinomonadaceae bacterium]